MIRLAARAAATLLLVVTTGGCFATRSDMRVLQGDIMNFRTESARADSARARQIAAVSAVLGTLNDSLKATSERLTRFQGDARGDLRSIQQQLLQVQELTGQSRKSLQEWQAEFEARNRAAVTPPTVATGLPADTTGAAPVAPTPGPNQLYQLAYDQLRRGSYSAARAAFEELLRLYPTSELAPAAQINIAEAFAAEGTAASADSAYAAVVAKYPRAPQAATALYKMALSMARQGKTADARTSMNRLVREYPTSDEADLAREWLRTNR